MPGRSRTQRNRTRRNRTRRNRTQRNRIRRNRTQRNRSRRNLHKTMRRKKNIKTNKFRNKRIVKTKRIKGGAPGEVGFRRTPGAVRSASTQRWNVGKNSTDDTLRYIDPLGLPQRSVPGSNENYTIDDGKRREEILEEYWGLPKINLPGSDDIKKNKDLWWEEHAVDGRVPEKLINFIKSGLSNAGIRKNVTKSIVTYSEMLVDWREFVELCRHMLPNNFMSFDQYKEGLERGTGNRGRSYDLNEYNPEYIKFYAGFLISLGMDEKEIIKMVYMQYIDGHNTKVYEGDEMAVAVGEFEVDDIEEMMSAIDKAPRSTFGPPPIFGGGPLIELSSKYRETGLRSTYGLAASYGLEEAHFYTSEAKLAKIGPQLFFLKGLPVRGHEFRPHADATENEDEGIGDYGDFEVERRTKLYQSIKPFSKKNYEYWFKEAKKENVPPHLLNKIEELYFNTNVLTNDPEYKDKQLIVALIELIIDVMDMNGAAGGRLPDGYIDYYERTYLN